ncbi:cilia- and flagella-associated protein 77 [Bombina bombina]|uniref:cilia- and flagella-associated protein 77 n=1 Tax=Bombina bombina TaxID=8345 RepID=UPI00235A6D0E|nr:cilia- and flagella-associated protein 77 [Bombina bombina]
MENERFGMVRESMQENQLLQKAELGKVKQRCYKLPGENFVYGLNTAIKEGGVAEAIGHWQTVESLARPRKLVPNFQALNREAVKSGLVTSAEHTAYRNTHHIWLKFHEGGKRNLRMQFPPDMTFGISTRPSTPIFDLMENRYQHLWEEQQRKVTEELRHKAKQMNKIGKVQDTRTTLLRRYQPPDEPAPLWQLPRFQKIGPHLDTFPSQEARRKAFSAQHSDAIARRGLYGRGIYTVS